MMLTTTTMPFKLGEEEALNLKFKFAMLIIPFRFHINRKKFTMARNNTESIDFAEGTLSDDVVSISLGFTLFASSCERGKKSV